MAGFFPASALTSQRRAEGSLVPKCAACKLHEGCRSPKMPVSGRGREGILVIGDAPGAADDDRGKPFAGSAGDMLRDALRRHGIDLRRDCWTMNALSCKPPKGRAPTAKEVGFCRPTVLREIREREPRAVLLVGAAAVRSVIGHVIGEDIGKIGKWVGWTIPSRKPNAWICPTWHPSYVGREGRNGEADPVLGRMFDRHLERFAAVAGSRPWDAVPDVARGIELIYSPSEAAAVIDEWIADGGPVVFDYETNNLKPDWAFSEIVCCSVCWRGKRTIAFPMTPQTADALRRLLAAPNPKLGANIKFEERWSQRVLGVRVRNWVFDCVNGAHVADNRRGITGVKFQAYVRRGVAPWNRKVEKFLDGPANAPNRIREVSLADLLLYCGIDSRVEWDLCADIMAELRLPFPE